MDHQLLCVVDLILSSSQRIHAVSVIKIVLSHDVRLWKTELFTLLVAVTSYQWISKIFSAVNGSKFIEISHQKL